MNLAAELDYGKLMQIRSTVIRDKVSCEEVYFSSEKSNEYLVYIPIDAATEIILEKFSFGNPITAYAGNRVNYEEKKALIANLGLAEYELAILVCLKLAVWGETNINVSQIREVDEEEEYKNKLQDVNSLILLMDLIQQFDSYVNGILPSSSDSFPEYVLKEVTFSFQKGTNQVKSKNRKITFNSEPGFNLIQHVLSDYLILLHGKGMTFEESLMLRENYINRRPNIKIESPHYVFHYKFISFLEELSNFKDHSKAQLLNIYAQLMDETEFTVNKAPHSNSASSIKNWYKRGKYLASKTVEQ
jgi:hypothetical protein